MRVLLAVSIAVAFLIFLSAAAHAQTQEPDRGQPQGQTSRQTSQQPHSVTVSAIRSTSRLDCGVVSEADDWNRTDLHGNLSALGGDNCRAAAIAILGNAEGLKIHTFPAEPEALAAPQAGTIQLATTISPEPTIATRYGWHSARRSFTTRSGCWSRVLPGSLSSPICATGSFASSI